MKRCKRCGLPETFPGIKFDEEGICNFCRSYRGDEKLEKAMTKYRNKFDKLLEEKKRAGSYDALMAYSGGKDSSYTLKVLREKYNLSILALTMDNGFISPTTIENINNVVEKLGVDLIIYKPRFDILRTLFSTAKDSDIYPRKTLERASTICTTCMGIIKFISLRLAIEKNIPFIAYGWSPGQAPVEASIFKNNPSMIRSMQKVLLEPMRKIVGDDILQYFLTEEHFTMEDRFPYNVSPMAFLEYDEEKIIEEIAELGWRKPDDTDPNSTNCLLNTFGIKIHKERLGFHPYAYELANLVREGYMDRDEAVERLETKEDERILELVKKKLGID